MYRLQTNLGYTDPLLYSLQSPVTPSAGDLPFSPTAVSPDENVAMPTPPSTPGQLGPPFSTAAPASDSIAAWSPTASTALPPIQTRREAAEAPLNGRVRTSTDESSFVFLSTHHYGTHRLRLLLSTDCTPHPSATTTFPVGYPLSLLSTSRA